MKNILVLCTGNSCRSQMAHGYFKQLGGDKLHVYSAGVETHGLNKRAVKVMMLDGVDISSHTSNLVEDYSQINFDFIITVCDHAKETCPVISSKGERFHHNFTDPSKIESDNEEEIMNAFVKTREEIKSYVTSFLKVNLA